MNKLQKLYSIIDNSREVGVKLNNDVLRQVEELEEQIIKEEILPALSEDIAPRLNPIKRDLVLVVEYRPGEPISVALSRKAKISDFTDAKPLTPVSPLNNHEDSQHERRSYVRHERGGHNASATGLRVKFPDGDIICEQKAVDTLRETIYKIGLENVARVCATNAYPVLNTCQVELITKKKAFNDYYASRQHFIKDGYLMFTCTSTEVKKRQIEAISKALGLGLRVEIVK